jgi:hypothetical protein
MMKFEVGDLVEVLIRGSAAVNVGEIAEITEAKHGSVHNTEGGSMLYTGLIYRLGGCGRWVAPNQIKHTKSLHDAFEEVYNAV